MINRLPGVLMLQSSAYREVATDQRETRDALLIVVAVALIRGAAHAIARAGNGSTALLPDGYGIPQGYMLDLPVGTDSTILLIARLAVSVVFALLFWSAGARTLTFVARRVFHAQVTRSNILRITGHTSLFQLLELVPIPFVSALLGLVFQTIGNTIGVREAGKITTRQAVLTTLLSLLLMVVTIAVISIIVTLIILSIVIGGNS